MAKKEYFLDEVDRYLVDANRDCQAWLAERAVDKYREACSTIAALEHQRARIAKAALMKPPDAHSEDRERLSMGDSSARAAVLAERVIVYDGCRYYYYGQYRYDNPQCAIDYAEPQRVRNGGATPEIPVPPSPKSNAPMSDHRDLMLSAGVSFAKGMRHLEEYCYDKLDDALAYAALTRARHARQASAAESCSGKRS